MPVEAANAPQLVWASFVSCWRPRKVGRASSQWLSTVMDPAVNYFQMFANMASLSLPSTLSQLSDGAQKFRPHVAFDAGTGMFRIFPGAPTQLVTRSTLLSGPV